MGWGYPWNKNANPLALPPGSLRDQITIQAKGNQQDSFGAQAETWNTVLTTMAKIDTLNIREGYQPGQFVAEATHTISMRWPGASIAIAGGMRIVTGARKFEIQSIENVQQRNRVLNLKCLELNGVQ